jgi:hypothetical protein
MRKTFGAGHRLYGAVVVYLADNLRLQGKPSEAAALYREALALPIQKHRVGVNRSVCIQRLVEVLMEGNNSSGVDAEALLGESKAVIQGGQNQSVGE